MKSNVTITTKQLNNNINLKSKSKRKFFSDLRNEIENIELILNYNSTNHSTNSSAPLTFPPPV